MLINSCDNELRNRDISQRRVENFPANCFSSATHEMRIRSFDVIRESWQACRLTCKCQLESASTIHPPEQARALIASESRMATLQIDPDVPTVTPAQSLSGWRRELCIELQGEGAARIFVRAAQESSFKAAELQRAVLFHRLDPRFTDLMGCVQALQPDLDRLVDTARRNKPDRESLFATVTYDRTVWEHVQKGIDAWVRRSKR